MVVLALRPRRFGKVPALPVEGPGGSASRTDSSGLRGAGGHSGVWLCLLCVSGLLQLGTHTDRGSAPHRDVAEVPVPRS